MARTLKLELSAGRHVRRHFVRGLRLIRNPEGNWTDQYGRVLQEYLDRTGKPDLRPIGLDPRGARH